MIRKIQLVSMTVIVFILTIFVIVYGNGWIAVVGVGLTIWLGIFTVEEFMGHHDGH